MGLAAVTRRGRSCHTAARLGEGARDRGELASHRRAAGGLGTYSVRRSDEDHQGPVRQANQRRGPGRWLLSDVPVDMLARCEPPMPSPEASALARRACARLRSHVLTLPGADRGSVGRRLH